MPDNNISKAQPRKAKGLGGVFTIRSKNAALLYMYRFVRISTCIEINATQRHLCHIATKMVLSYPAFFNTQFIPMFSIILQSLLIPQVFMWISYYNLKS